MKILAIMGSPKGKGNTYEVTRQVEEQMRQRDVSIEFEYIFLKSANLQTCKGCFLCLEKGEDCCPLKDDRALIEQKMNEADGVIVASPVYVYSVTWLMKNFIDRFAYRCHRPGFNGKRAMVVSTTGAVGLKYTLYTLAFQVGTWGFDIVHKLGVITPPGKLSEEYKKDLNTKTKRSVKKAADSFYKELKKQALSKPSFIKLLTFLLQKDAFSKADKNLADYKYWEEKGWFEKGAKYYYETKIGTLKRVLTGIIARLISFSTPKQANNFKENGSISL